jgi:hypothetical protein
VAGDLKYTLQDFSSLLFFAILQKLSDEITEHLHINNIFFKQISSQHNKRYRSIITAIIITHVLNEPDVILSLK